MYRRREKLVARVCLLLWLAWLPAFDAFGIPGSQIVSSVPSQQVPVGQAVSVDLVLDLVGGDTASIVDGDFTLSGLGTIVSVSPIPGTSWIGQVNILGGSLSTSLLSSPLGGTRTLATLWVTALAPGSFTVSVAPGFVVQTEVFDPEFQIVDVPLDPPAVPLLTIDVVVPSQQPDAPQPVTLVGRTQSSLDVSFLEPPTNGATITGYEVRLSGSSDMSAPLIHPDITNSLVRGFSGLSVDTDYWIDVRALVALPGVHSERSAPASFKTLAQPDTPAPPGMQGSTGSELFVTLQSPNPNGATLTLFEVRIADNPSMSGATSSPDLSQTLERVFEGLAKDTDYWVDFRALVASPDVASERSTPGGPFTTQATAAVPLLPLPGAVVLAMLLGACSLALGRP